MEYACCHHTGKNLHRYPGHLVNLHQFAALCCIVADVRCSRMYESLKRPYVRENRGCAGIAQEIQIITNGSCLASRQRNHTNVATPAFHMCTSCILSRTRNYITSLLTVYLEPPCSRRRQAAGCPVDWTEVACLMVDATAGTGHILL